MSKIIDSIVSMANKFEKLAIRKIIENPTTNLSGGTYFSGEQPASEEAVALYEDLYRERKSPASKPESAVNQEPEQKPIRRMIAPSKPIPEEVSDEDAEDMLNDILGRGKPKSMAPSQTKPVVPSQTKPAVPSQTKQEPKSESKPVRRIVPTKSVEKELPAKPSEPSEHELEKKEEESRQLEKQLGIYYNIPEERRPPLILLSVPLQKLIEKTEKKLDTEKVLLEVERYYNSPGMSMDELSDRAKAQLQLDETKRTKERSEEVKEDTSKYILKSVKQKPVTSKSIKRRLFEFVKGYRDLNPIYPTPDYYKESNGFSLVGSRINLLTLDGWKNDKLYDIEKPEYLYDEKNQVIGINTTAGGVTLKLSGKALKHFFDSIRSDQKDKTTI